MRSTHDVKGFRMVEYNDDAARHLSLLSNNSVIEQQFNEMMAFIRRQGHLYERAGLANAARNSLLRDA